MISRATICPTFMAVMSAGFDRFDYVPCHLVTSCSTRSGACYCSCRDKDRSPGNTTSGRAQRGSYVGPKHAERQFYSGFGSFRNVRGLCWFGVRTMVVFIRRMSGDLASRGNGKQSSSKESERERER